MSTTEQTDEIRIEMFETQVSNAPTNTARILLKDMNEQPITEAEQVPYIDRDSRTLRRSNGNILKNYVLNVDNQNKIMVWYDALDKIYFVERVFSDGNCTSWYGPYCLVKGEKLA